MISTKGRYALRVMIDLAEQPEGRPIPLKEIAERQGISKKYLEIIMKDLVDGKLVKGSSGKGGGYVLLRKPEEYPIGSCTVNRSLECYYGPGYDYKQISRNVPAGVYVLRVTDTNRKEYLQKIVIK